MANLTNKKTSFSVTNNTDSLKLSGSVTVTEDSRISELNGQYLSTEDNYLGSFYYSEYESGKVTKNISDLDLAASEEATTLLDKTISEIKKEFVTNDNE